MHIAVDGACGFFIMAEEQAGLGLGGIRLPPQQGPPTGKLFLGYSAGHSRTYSSKKTEVASYHMNFQRGPRASHCVNSALRTSTLSGTLQKLV